MSLLSADERQQVEDFALMLRARYPRHVGDAEIVEAMTAAWNERDEIDDDHVAEAAVIATRALRRASRLRRRAPLR